MKVTLFIPAVFFVFIITPGASAQSLLPEGPNQKLVELVCSKCHTTDRIASKRMSKTEWTEEVAEMLQEEDDVTEEEKDMIIDYLYKTFPDKAEFNNRVATNKIQPDPNHSVGNSAAIKPFRRQKSDAQKLQTTVPCTHTARVYPPMDGWSFSRPDRRPSLLVLRQKQGTAPSGFRT